jgi:Domain of unknown function (DUF4145)
VGKNVMKIFGTRRYRWVDTSEANYEHFICGYCGRDAGPSKMYISEAFPQARILICPTCTMPTTIEPSGEQFPKPKAGSNIEAISDEGVARLYDEARECTSIGAYTACVMLCRKIVMNLAVSLKANENGKFAYYVDFLSDNGYVPPQGKKWVTKIKDRGNDANHEIQTMEEPDAKLILHFTASLLRFNYELPSLLEPEENPA